MPLLDPDEAAAIQGDLLAYYTTAATWRPRFSSTPFATLGLGLTPDPHDAIAAGIARCPVCWDATLQRPASTADTTCFGTGWTGGYGAARKVLVLVTRGQLRITEQETGQQVIAPGIWCAHNPASVLLPGDLLVVNSAPTVRYLVGELVQEVTVEATDYQRRVQLLPVSDNSYLQAVPLVPVP